MFKITESKELSPSFPTFLFFHVVLNILFAEFKWKPKGMGGAFCSCAHYHPAVFWLWFRRIQFLIKAKIEGTALALKNCFLSIYPYNAFIKWIKCMDRRSFYISMKNAACCSKWQTPDIGNWTKNCFMTWTCSSVSAFNSVVWLLLLCFTKVSSCSLMWKQRHSLHKIIGIILIILSIAAADLPTLARLWASVLFPFEHRSLSRYKKNEYPHYSL